MLKIWSGNSRGALGSISTKKKLISTKKKAGHKRKAHRKTHQRPRSNRTRKLQKKLSPPHKLKKRQLLQCVFLLLPYASGRLPWERSLPSRLKISPMRPQMMTLISNLALLVVKLPLKASIRSLHGGVDAELLWFGKILFFQQLM
jgi:hypothetical protein